MKKRLLLLVLGISSIAFAGENYDVISQKKAQACYKQALKLLTPSKVDEWALRSWKMNDDANNVDIIATRNEEKAEIGWSQSTGRQAVQGCLVTKFNKYEEEVFNKEGSDLAYEKNPKFF